MKCFFITSFFFLFSFAQGQTQVQFIRVDTIPVLIGTQSLINPWAGGINYGQFSEIDLDQDGTMDLFVFDRTGNKITTYINNGTVNAIDYKLAAQYVAQFPILHDWAILRDYNCDGKMDIFTAFTGSSPGISVWKNTSTLAAGLQFQLVADSLISNLTPNSTNINQTIWVTNVDIPAVRDIDNDGDLDVLTFDGSGTHVEFHRNMSVENFGICDSLLFKIQTSCWGNFAENTLNANLTLNDSCAAPAINNQNSTSTQSAQHNLHNGSCIECIQTDNDNDHDILIGDISNQYITYGRNGGSSSFATIDSVDTRFPDYDSTLTMFIWNCAYHIDVNNDGKKDLIMCPNASNASENKKSCWYYQNTGTNTAVQVQFIKNNLLQDEMIEVGEGSFPRLFDYDNDGDQDLFIGNYGYYSSSSAYASKIALYKNIGTINAPSFKLLTDDFINLHATTSNIVAPVPTFGDLDGDGDKDLIIGDAIGKLHYYRKDPGPADNFVFMSSNYSGIDVGNYATPQLIDVDRDGIIDLLIGEQSGNVNYYKNTGTASIPNFALNTAILGNVIVNQVGYTTGYSVPFLWDHNGSYSLLVGSERGFLFRYDNIDGNLGGNFTLTDSLYVSSREGLRIAPCMGILNNDTLPDLMIGNYAGGVSVFYADLINEIASFEIHNYKFEIFPNPTSGNFNITNSIQQSDFPATFKMLNMEGQIIFQKEINSTIESIDVTKFAAGIYNCTLTPKNRITSHQKIVIIH